MNPVSLCLNLVLAGLLLLTLSLGWRLNGRLKALKAGHADFAAAIADLDRSSRRAEKGLADMRISTDEAVQMLSGRIEKGRDLAHRLERLTEEAKVQASALQVAARPANDAGAPTTAAALSPQLAALDRIWTKPQPDEALIAVDAELRSQLQKLSRAFSGVGELTPVSNASLAKSTSAKPVASAQAAPILRSRALIDEDLFETGPSQAASRQVAGRAGSGGR